VTCEVRRFGGQAHIALSSESLASSSLPEETSLAERPMSGETGEGHVFLGANG